MGGIFLRKSVWSIALAALLAGTVTGLFGGGGGMVLVPLLTALSDLEENQIFSASLENRTTEDLLLSDYKEFHIAGHDLAVAQVTCVDSPKMLERKDEFLALMKRIAQEKGFDLVILMLTDVLLEGTQIVYLGNDDTIRQAFNVQPKESTVFLPQIMSRKKQVIPMLSALWG